MSEAIATYTFKDGSTLKIHLDDQPESPREWDNLGTIVCFHRNYDFGDDHDYRKDDYISSMDGWNELKKDIEKDNDNEVIILPIYMFDDWAITINTTGFQRCQEQIGFIFVSQDTLRKEQLDGDDKDIAQYLRNEVEIYNQYLRGDVYGYVFTAPPVECESCSHKEYVDEDSCWGFYGSDPIKNGMIDSFGDEYIEALKNKDYELEE